MNNTPNRPQFPLLQIQTESLMEQVGRVHRKLVKAMWIIAVLVVLLSIAVALLIITWAKKGIL